MAGPCSSDLSACIALATCAGDGVAFGRLTSAINFDIPILDRERNTPGHPVVEERAVLKDVAADQGNDPLLDQWAADRIERVDRDGKPDQFDASRIDVLLARGV